jgi:hypothetical protein
MRGVAFAIGVGFVVAGATFAACSSPRSGTQSPDQQGNPPIGFTSGSNPDGTGTVNATLLLGPNANVTSLNWSISGPNSYSGVIQIGDAQSVEVVAGGIAAGSGYTMTISGADSAGDPCSGTSNAFTVAAGTLTIVTLSVTCVSPPDGSVAADVGTGSVEVDASVTLVTGLGPQCPGINSLTVNPAEVTIVQPAQLGVMTTAASSVQWTVSTSDGGAGGGTFVNPADGGPGANLANPEFFCAAPNTQVTVTATVGLLDSGACTGTMFTSLSALINCEVACNAATDCPGTDTVCLPRSCIGGRCGFQATPEGTSCDSAGDICSGTGSCIPFTFSVVRIGTGAGGTLTAAAAPVFIEQRLVSDGGLVGTPISLPTVVPDAGQDLLTEPGLVLIAGLSRSQDGHYLTMAGYNDPVGNPNPANSTSAIVVARIDSAGNVDTSTQFASGAFISANSLRGSVTANGTAFWVGGLGATTDGGVSTGGIWYIPFGLVGGTQLSSMSTRLLNITGNQLYGTPETAGAPAGTPSVFSVGTGLPTSGAQTLSGLPGLPVIGSAASPWAFVFVQVGASSSGPDTLYVAQSNVTTGVPFGIQRYSLSGGTWSLTATLTLPGPDGGAGVGFRGLTGLKTGPGQVTLLATSVEVGSGSPTRVVAFTDDGVSNPWSGTWRVLATANGLQDYYRGIALSPHP